MLGRMYESQNCSAARALELVGERWSLLILRNAAFAGQTRFSEFERGLGIAPNILGARLESFVAAGLMEMVPAADHKGQHDYVLTDKGRDFVPALIALTNWGDRWAAPDGPPIQYKHTDCDGDIEIQLHCTKCSDSVEPATVVVEPGPGFRADFPRTRNTNTTISAPARTSRSRSANRITQ